MKLRLLTILIFCSFSSKEKQNPYSEQLATYLKHKDFFRLERCFNANRQHLNTKDYLYYSAVIDNAFNRCGPSARDIDQLLKNYTAKLNLRTKAALLALQVDNYVKTYNYAKAAKTNELLISIYK